MHNAMIKGDTETMKILLDSGSVKMDEWVGFGNIQTWVEDACWSGSPVALEYLLQRGADTLRADTANPHFPKLRPSNALGWCVGDSSMTFISSDGGSTTRPLGRGDVDSAKVFRIFIKYFEQQVNKTTDPDKTLNEQVAMAGGTGPLIWSAVGNQYDDVCLEKVTWLVESGQDITKLERRDNWQTLLDNRSKTNPTCVAYLRNELEKKGSGRTINPPQTERREPSTEQRTGAANMELGRLARQANGLSADQASRLEESLIHDPNDLAARAQLLGYYFAASPRLNPQTVHEARVRHILWLVQNEPESELAGMSEATIDPVGDSLADPAVYEKVKALWLEQVKSHPGKVMVLVNAAWFFKLPDKAIAADLLTRAHAIDPGNQNASAGLGIVYAAAIVGLTGMNQNRFPTETKPEEAGSPFAQKAREELNKSQDAQVIGTAGYYLNFWGSILSAQGKTLTDYEDLAEKCLTKAQTLDPGNPEWARDLASLYKLRAMKAKSPQARAKPPTTTPQAKSSSEQDSTSNVRSLATEFLKYPAVASCSKKDCTILVTNFVLPDGNTSPYGMQLADELSKELASQNHKIQVIDRGLLQDFLAKNRVPAKSINAGVVRSIVFALKARFVVVGITKRTDDDVVQLSTRLFDVADKNGSGYSAVVVNLLAPKSSVDLSPSEPFASLPPITSTSSGKSSSRPGVDGVSLPPKCAYMPNPPYSEEPRKFQLSGVITVDAVLNAKGRPENVRIVSGLPGGLNELTIATMKDWRCNPALKDGQPVPTRVQFQVNFRLY